MPAIARSHTMHRIDARKCFHGVSKYTDVSRSIRIHIVRIAEPKSGIRPCIPRIIRDKNVRSIRCSVEFSLYEPDSADCRETRWNLAYFSGWRPEAKCNIMLVPLWQ